jgi:hypothetical protein
MRQLRLPRLCLERLGLRICLRFFQYHYSKKAFRATGAVPCQPRSGWGLGNVFEGGRNDQRKR